MTVMPACTPEQVFAMRADVVIAILLARADLMEAASRKAAGAMRGGGRQTGMSTAGVSNDWNDLMPFLKRPGEET